MKLPNFLRYLREAFAAGRDGNQLMMASLDNNGRVVVTRAPSSLGAATLTAAGGGAHPGGGDSGASPRVVEQTHPGVPRLTDDGGPVIDDQTEWRWRRALLRISRDGCWKRYGVATSCCDNPEMVRADWCLPCIAHHALNPQAPSTPVSLTPGAEAASPDVNEQSSRDTSGDVSNFP
jgi:hypothetical protein